MGSDDDAHDPSDPYDGPPPQQSWGGEESVNQIRIDSSGAAKEPLPKPGRGSKLRPSAMKARAQS